MTAAIPTVEPAEVVAGDTWSWQKALADYPANASPAWTLTYYFRSVAGEFTAAAAASGADHLVTVTKTASAAYKAGLYEWTAIVTDGVTRTTLGRGTTTIKPDPSKTGAGFDPRSHARKTLEAIEAVLEKRATQDQMRYTIGTRSLDRTPIADLIVLRDKYRAEVDSEEASERLSKGLGGGRKIQVRF